MTRRRSARDLIKELIACAHDCDLYDAELRRYIVEFVNDGSEDVPRLRTALWRLWRVGSCTHATYHRIAAAFEQLYGPISPKGTIHVHDQAGTAGTPVEVATNPGDRVGRPARRPRLLRLL